jgi:tRNA-splicing endonuclease subunit Sen54
LKRLGYTVQRTRQFIPHHFLAASQLTPASSGSLVRTCLQLPCKLLGFVKALFARLSSGVAHICCVGLGLPVAWSRPLRQTVLSNWTGSTYGAIQAIICSVLSLSVSVSDTPAASIFSHLRFVPAGHSNPVPSAPAPIGVAAASPEASVYAPLDTNPYLPFFHVWKPVSSWSKVKWDRGSSEGIAQQKPDYILAVVEYVFNMFF